MKKFAFLLGLAILLGLLSANTTPTAAASAVIQLMNPPPGVTLTLEVGESYTFVVTVDSDEAFTLARAMQNAYFPGRGLNWRSSRVVNHDTHATFYLTTTAKSSTASLHAVCDWPEPGTCWPVGTAPISIVAGARYRGGLVLSEEFNVGIIVR